MWKFWIERWYFVANLEINKVEPEQGIVEYGYKNIKQFRYVIQYIAMHIPVIKDVLIYNEVVMFTKTFSSLIKHDVFITDSMEILNKISNNEIYKNTCILIIMNHSTSNRFIVFNNFEYIFIYLSKLRLT